MAVVSVRVVKGNAGSGKIPSGHGKEGRDTFEMSKENLLNCSPFSLFEAHAGRGSTEGVRSKAGGEAKATRSALHPRKRSLSESRLSAPPSTTRGRELSPPELTTSDNFKPAKRVLGPKPALQEKKKPGPVKVGLPSSSPADPNPAKTVPRFSIPVDTRNPDSRSPKVGVSTNRNNSSTRKAPITGRRSSVVRVSISKEKGVLLTAKDAVKDNVKDTVKKVMVFSAKKSDRLSSPTVAPKDVERVRTRVTEKRAASAAKSPVPSGKPPSRPVKPDVLVKDEPAAKSRVDARQSNAVKAMADSIRSRKLSSVLQNEQRLQEQNKRLELQLSQLQEELAEKDHEIERLRSAGRLLNAQSYEVRDLKFKLRETFNENAEVRDVCEKLEKERQEAHAARKKVTDEEQNSKALEVQLALLTEQLHNMGVGLPKSSNELLFFERNGSTAEDQNVAGLQVESATVEEPTFEVYSEDQTDLSSKTDVDDAESEGLSEGVRVPQWSVAIEGVTKEVPVSTQPKVLSTGELPPDCNHEELLAAIRAVRDVHDAEDNSSSDSMKNELEVIEDLQNALKIINDLHPEVDTLLIQ
ncbi:hypothetical protein MPTK1_1g10450 [Marchantia polymorpha subsp. ruderalis]|nr:hypothetical protein MARPO_0014s0182 [Marchantia polymorpha]BBM98053.1 hypothetical protein Mp_1g10450 [Marchantia polymorpha subsp. ruderalis]|eukprot:PTQ45673.1 hypothetical protein MARPO_0014s0182 [Marchantia polymorpha]